MYFGGLATLFWLCPPYSWEWFLDVFISVVVQSKSHVSPVSVCCGYDLYHLLSCEVFVNSVSCFPWHLVQDDMCLSWSFVCPFHGSFRVPVLAPGGFVLVFRKGCV